MQAARGNLEDSQLNQLKVLQLNCGTQCSVLGPGGAGAVFLVNQALEGIWFYFIFVTKLLQVSPKQSWLCPGLAWGALAPAL